MPLYKPSELREFLDSLGASAKKALSQNFLIDANILQKIIDAGDVKKGDLILEIGPGPGALTERLLESGAHVVAVEKDPLFAEALKRLQTEDHRLDVFEEDILKFPLENIFNRAKTVKMIANLPYHLTTPILAKFVPLFPLFSSLTVMVQEEVARRFVAKPGSANYSSFTVFLNFYSTPSYAFKVSRNCFYPAPNVDSAIVSLSLKKAPKIDTKAFFTFTRCAFGQRRKMMRASLKFLYPSEKVMEGLESIGKNALARPEELSLEDFLSLFSFLEKPPEHSKT